MRVYLIDSGTSNIFNMRRALEHCRADVVVVKRPEDLAGAELVVLPGVGSFPACMRSLRDRGLFEPMRELIRSGRPFLGVCLGLQVLFDHSEEVEAHAGMGVLPGRVEQIPKMDNEGERLKTPHIGWAALRFPNSRPPGERGILESIGHEDAVYFVHGFHAIPRRNEDLLASVEYGGHTLTAAVQHENVTGLQFHPERSGFVGLRVLENFLAESSFRKK